MTKRYRDRDFDEWYEDQRVLFAIQLDEDNRIKVLNDVHYDADTDEAFWHGIKFQRIIKTRKGDWRYREKLNIPFDHFEEFYNLVLKVKNQLKQLGQIT
jgi:hypothetical protein